MVTLLFAVSAAAAVELCHTYPADPTTNTACNLVPGVAASVNGSTTIYVERSAYNYFFFQVLASLVKGAVVAGVGCDPLVSSVVDIMPLLHAPAASSMDRSVVGGGRLRVGAVVAGFL